MAAVSETIVREYFELHEFLVRQRTKFISQTHEGEDDDIDFFVLNPRTAPPLPQGGLPFVLASADLPHVSRALVVVKPWHTEVFSAARLAASPQILRFTESQFFKDAAAAFGEGGPALRLLVVPALPREARAREESIALLRAKRIDAVIPFRVMLADLIATIEPNRNYAKSDLLQTIRILKNYDFFKGPQLELFRTRKKRRKPGN
jgi:hypothetical protein